MVRAGLVHPSHLDVVSRTMLGPMASPRTLDTLVPLRFMALVWARCSMKLVATTAASPRMDVSMMNE